MTLRFHTIVLFGTVSVLSVQLSAQEPDLTQRLYPWLDHAPADTIENRYAPPLGFSRPQAEGNSFTAWLRGLPLLKGRPNVLLFDGREKNNQAVHDAVVDIDVGNRDLQQCADAVMRLRAEYLRASGQADHISFRFTNGVAAKWRDWRRGFRPQVSGNKTSWVRTGRPAADYKSFRRYLTKVFQYAGTASLSREMKSVAEDSLLTSGNVFIKGGFPGHAVIVVDTATDNAGEQVLLLAQSYMPAQQIHILKNPNEPQISPWYRYRRGPLATPEWHFDADSLKGFPDLAGVSGRPAR